MAWILCYEQANGWGAGIPCLRMTESMLQEIQTQLAVASLIETL